MNEVSRDLVVNTDSKKKQALMVNLFIHALEMPIFDCDYIFLPFGFLGGKYNVFISFMFLITGLASGTG